MIALDVKTGKLKWYYQFTPHDVHDYDATEVPILADLTNCSVTPTGAIQLGAKNSATAIGFQGKASYITYRQYT